MRLPRSATIDTASLQAMATRKPGFLAPGIPEKTNTAVVHRMDMHGIYYPTFKGHLGGTYIGEIKQFIQIHRASAYGRIELFDVPCDNLAACVDRHPNA